MSAEDIKKLDEEARRRFKADPRRSYKTKTFRGVDAEHDAGKQLKSIRLELGLSRKEMSKLLGLKYASNLADMENRGTPMAATRLLIKARKILQDYRDGENENNF